MKAVVSGATGFVGKWLVEELLNRDNEVTVIIRDKTNIPKSWIGNVKICECDLQKYDQLNVENEDQDCFFHLAWGGTSGIDRSNVRLQLYNIQATCDAVKVAKKLGCRRFIYAGSIMEYEAISCVGTGVSNLGMGYIYSTAKLTADYMAKIICSNIHMEYISVIISNIYGVGERSARFLNTTIKQMLKDETILLTEGIQTYDFIYVTDAVKQIILAAEKGKTNQEYYIGNSEQRKLKDFLIDMKTVLKSNSNLKFGDVPMPERCLTYHEFDTEKMERLGFKPKVPFIDGIIMTSNWIKEQENEQFI